MPKVFYRCFLDPSFTILNLSTFNVLKHIHGSFMYSVKILSREFKCFALKNTLKLDEKICFCLSFNVFNDLSNFWKKNTSFKFLVQRCMVLVDFLVWASHLYSALQLWRWTLIMHLTEVAGIKSCGASPVGKVPTKKSIRQPKWQCSPNSTSLTWSIFTKQKDLMFKCLF